ncbi:MFS transporter, DHA2 family, multidrug resistance protein [Saccharopolyspora antimicrobica]|uniref:DHA2 family multidrug resistance protein-like MFS transporter n=1 Tax=Saccharopolyspora antimicrobica TaxID=455193 RepID=A0A1I5CRP8_9PSEU|nr:MFS transporter [Saccharopolyspora antimicrobica]RKT88773.1 DHA2 family multidrug resistance protein-like MFS transporter [Saccharopolyspora antimicrobica]SFN89536.1 MFS transporter, DHA2 family, multidrug resistance protein [Saccharopolyspora antimicrobica]
MNDDAGAGSALRNEVSQRRWLVLGILCTTLLLVGMDLTILHVAVPTLSQQLLPSASQLLWMVDSYPLTVAAFLVTCGTLSDRIGRKKVLLGGFAVFGLASAGAAFATTPVVLIGFRAALGFGAAMIAAATVAIIRITFPDARERAFAIGVWSACHSAGAAIGPIAAGFLLEHFWWGSVFLINVPVVLVALVVGAVVVPESKDEVRRRWDALSAVMSVLGLGGLVYALKQIGEHGSVSAPNLMIGVVAVALLIAFVVRQRRIREPLLDLSLFADRKFSVATGAILASFAGYIALMFFATQHFQLVSGYSPLLAGAALLPMAAANAVGAVLAPNVAAVLSDRVAITLALLVFGGSMLGLALLGPGSGYGVVVALLAGSGLGVGVVTTLGSDVIMSAADPSRAGAAGAIQETSFELGSGLGIVVLGTTLSVIYRNTLEPVAGVASAQHAEAQNSLGAAVQIAGGLDEQMGAALRTAAVTAFGNGFSAAAVMGGAMLLVVAVASWFVLRER